MEIEGAKLLDSMSCRGVATAFCGTIMEVITGMIIKYCERYIKC
jgi:hypothetical protein